MSLKETMQNDLAIIVNDLDSPTFTWNGEDYLCIASSLGEQLVLGADGGFESVDGLNITVSLDQFSDDTLPKEQQIVTHKGKSFRINKVNQNITDAFIRLICVSISRGV